MEDIDWSSLQERSKESERNPQESYDQSKLEEELDGSVESWYDRCEEKPELSDSISYDKPRQKSNAVTPSEHSILKGLEASSGINKKKSDSALTVSTPTFPISFPIMESATPKGNQISLSDVTDCDVSIKHRDANHTIL